MFHVKHFGTIQTAKNEPRLVGLRASGKRRPPIGTRRVAALVFDEQDTIGLNPLCTDAGTSAWPRRADSFMVGLGAGQPAGNT
jgi:hypothetical protein